MNNYSELKDTVYKEMLKEISMSRNNKLHPMRIEKYRRDFESIELLENSSNKELHLTKQGLIGYEPY